jgi:capsular exopolysaccharide synthesis family protein
VTDHSFDNYLRLVRKNWLLILVAGLISASAAFLVSYSQPSKFRASSKILVSAGGTYAVSANEDPARIVDTLVKLAKSDGILAFSADRAHVSKHALDQAVGVSGSPTADVITVSATDRTAAGAARYANALATGFVLWREKQTRDRTRAQIAFLQAQLARLQGQAAPSAVAAAADIRTQLSQALAELQVPSSDLVIISQAQPPSARFAPNPVRNALLGLIAGLLIGLAAATIREQMDNRIHEDGELEELYGAPILGKVPYVSAARNGDRLAALADLAHETPLADAFRSIRTNVSLFKPAQTKTQVLLVTSAVAGEGKTTVTANLARAFAVSGQRVMAISADVHSPMLHLLLLADSSTDPAYGILEVLADKLELERSVRRHTVEGPNGRPGRVAVLANGRRFPDPSILYQSRVMEEVIAQARRLFDVVLIDSPPLLANAESALLATRADGLIMVSRTDSLTRQQAHQAKRVLEALDLKPLGMIVTGRESSSGYGYDVTDSPRTAQQPPSPLVSVSHREPLSTTPAAPKKRETLGT